MADRFPLIVNSVSQKIEELISGDNLDLTGNNIRASSSTGTAGQYLRTDGSVVLWDNPGDVYLTEAQTITNKTIESSFLSGNTNTFSNIPNSALNNSSITVNGTAIALGGSVVTPNDNTTYAISAVDGAANQKIIRLTAGGSGSGTDDVSIAVAPYAGVLPANHKVANLYIARSGDQITLSASAEDRDTITRVGASGGTFVTGDVTIAAGAFTTVTQLGNTITVTGQDTNTVTRVTENVSGSGTLVSGDITLASGTTNLSIAQVGNTFTFNSLDTITRARATGANGGSYVSGDISFSPGTNVGLVQVGNTITINSSFTNTETFIRGTSGGTYVSGNVTLAQGGATTITQGIGQPGEQTITISSVDTNTTFSPLANGGLVISGAAAAGAPNGTQFSIKNVSNLTNATLMKWDGGNYQLTDSIIEDDGSTITINGDLTVTGTQTVLETQTLIVEDNIIELRKGLSLAGDNGGIQVNRSTNVGGTVTSYSQLAWYETGQYWRTFDGSISHRLVTEAETQNLTNKTLTSPTLVTPNIGVATATNVNGLAISQVVGGTLTIANNKSFTCSSTLTFQGADGSTVSFGTGGSVVYTSNRIDALALTSSSQLAGKISDETGGGGKLMFNLNPAVQTGITTPDTTFTLIDTNATLVNFAGDCTTLHIGSGRPQVPATPSNTVRIFDAMTLQCDGDVILGDTFGDNLTVNGAANFANVDILIQGITFGRGNNNLQTNIAIGENSLGTITSGTQNTAVGHSTGISLNAGASNTLLGTRAGFSTSIGNFNVVTGRDALYGNQTGSRNAVYGTNAGYNTTGSSNLFLGHYAGHDCTGSGNVIIGPASDENGTNPTYAPPSPSGDRQLVIGSGTGFWMRGDNAYNLTLPNNLGIGGDLSIGGNLTVSGTVTTINSNTLSVDDKNIELGAVENVLGFTASASAGSAVVSGVSSLENLISGMEVTIVTAGITFSDLTTVAQISSIDNSLNEITFNKAIIGGSGTVTFNAAGPSDLSADQGGIILRGTTNKTLLWVDATDAWTFSEHVDIATGKQLRIANITIANASTNTLGPTSGGWTLGAGVLQSSLTTVGTLTSLTVSGNLTVDTNTLFVDATNNRVRIGDGSGTTGSLSKLTLIGDQSAVYSSSYTDQYIYSPHEGELYIANTQLNTTGSFAGIVLRAGQTTTDIGINSARIAAIRTAAFTTDLAFQTRTDANGMSEKFRIAAGGDVTVSNGNLVIGTSGKGIDFSATANSSGNMTSELLDDYEEGTWSPGITGRTVSSPEGTYTKIGRQVLVRFLVQGLNSGITGTSIGITGLPFTASNINQNGAAFIADTSGVTYASASYGNIYGRINGGGTEIQLLQKLNDGSSHDTHSVGGGLSATCTLRGYAWYTTDT